MPEEQYERMHKLYRPSDKGKARKAASQKLSEDRAIKNLLSRGMYEGASAIRSMREQRKNFLTNQFASRDAQKVISDTQGLAKMPMKGFGN
jgi:hypothetical protein